MGLVRTSQWIILLFYAPSAGGPEIVNKK